MIDVFFCFLTAVIIGTCVGLVCYVALSCKPVLILLIIVALAFLCWLSVCVRVVLTHPFKTAFYAVKDSIQYLFYKKSRVCPTGRIICYIGMFGKGKTLSAVHDVIALYNWYNDKKIFDFHRMKWVTQKINIISNVDLVGINFTPFESLAQLVSIAEHYKKIDEDNDTRTVHIALGDEFSVQLNSRSFKTNIDPLFLNTLLTCRHHHISLVYTAQRFNHVDALLRQVTSYVISCDKCWRIMVHRKYDAYELEYASNPLDVQSVSKYGWFIRDKDFEAYDTLACVQNLSKSCTQGDMLTEAEILALQQNTPADMESVSKPSRRYLRRKKKVG